MSLYLRFKTKGFLIIKITAHKFNFMTSFDMIANKKCIIRCSILTDTQYLGIKEYLINKL